jgi:hypothetical protein
MYPAAGVHKNATKEATSSGSPTLPNGVLSSTDLTTQHDNAKYVTMFVEYTDS